MWCKARQTKDGDYENDDLRDKANEIVSIHTLLECIPLSTNIPLIYVVDRTLMIRGFKMDP